MAPVVNSYARTGTCTCTCTVYVFLFFWYTSTTYLPPPPISIPTTLSASPAPAPAPCARLATLTLKVGAINHTGCLQMQQSPCTNQPRWSPRQQRACAPGTARSPWQSGCLSIEACLQANVWLSLGQGLVWRVQHTHIDTYTHRHPHPHPHPHTYRNTHHLTGV